MWYIVSTFPVHIWRRDAVHTKNGRIVMMRPLNVIGFGKVYLTNTFDTFIKPFL